MPYNQNIPQPTDKLSQSQPQILANFQALNTLFEGEVPLDVLVLPVSGSDPTTAASQMALYTKLGTYSTVPELYVRRQNSGPVLSFTEGISGTNGWWSVPGGQLFKWGTTAVITTTTPFNINVTYPATSGFKPFTGVNNIQLTLKSNTNPGTGIAMIIGTPSTTGFTAQVSNADGNGGFNGNLYYFVIGF